MARYTYAQLRERIKILNEIKSDIMLSNQYGMLFLLDSEGRIILRIDELVSKKERLEQA